MKNLDKDINIISLLILSMFFITFSILSHFISSYFIEIKECIFIPSTITYMLCFSILEYLAVTQKKKIVLSLIIMEFICVFIYSIIIIFMLEVPDKYVFVDKEHYVTVFSPFKVMFFSNLIGVTFSYLCIYFVFNNIFLKNNDFLKTAFVTNFFLIIIYTPITDWLAFGHLNLNITNLILTNIITNLIFISIYTMVFRYFLLRRKYDL